MTHTTSSQTDRRRHRLGFWLLAAPLLAVAAQCPAVLAQEYETRVPKPYDSRVQSEYKRDIIKVVRGQADINDPAIKKRVNEWFLFFFDRMTLPERVNELPDDRRELFTQYLQQRPLNPTLAKAAHDYLVGITLKYMQVLAGPTFHPAVRYNAMTIIGDLNEVEPAIVGDKHPAEPLPDALDVLVRAFNSPSQIDAVRVAALLGILRHAERDGEKEINNRMDADYRGNLISLMADVVAGTKPPGKRSPEGQLWMKRRAVEVLGALRDVGQGGKAVALLTGIIDDEKAPISLRTTAAIALSRIRLPANYPLDVAATTKVLAEVASRAAHSEVSRLRRQQTRWAEAEKNKTGGDSMYDSFDDGMLEDDFAEDDFVDEPIDDLGDEDFGGDEFGSYSGSLVKVDTATRERYKLDLARRRLAYRLYGVQMALTGDYGPTPPSAQDRARQTQGIDKLAAATATPETTKLVGDVADRLRNLFKSAEKPEVRGNAEPPTPEEELSLLLDGLAAAVTDLDNAAGIKPPPTAPPGAGEPGLGPAAGPEGAPPATGLEAGPPGETPEAAPPPGGPPASSPPAAGPPTGEPAAAP